MTIEVETEHVTEVFTGFGERDRSAEAVAEQAVQQYQRYLKATCPWANTSPTSCSYPWPWPAAEPPLHWLSRHATTHIELIHKFLTTPVKTESASERGTLVMLGAS